MEKVTKQNGIYLATEAEKAQWEKDHTLVCPICGKTFIGYGNNPYPVANDGRCCDDCNHLSVIPMRLLLDRATGYIDDSICEMMLMKGNQTLFGIQNEIKIEGYPIAVQTIYNNGKIQMVCITDHPSGKQIQDTFNNYIEYQYNTKNVA
jgi:hypothetical protein